MNRESSGPSSTGGAPPGASPFKRKFKSKRMLFLGIALLLGTMFTLSDSARSSDAAVCAASGSIPLLASTGTTCGTALQIAQQKDITVSVHNTSTTSPGGVPVTASVFGTLTYDLACTTIPCFTPLPGTLVFVPQ